MKRRKVFVWLLASGLAVSAGGMTVLAAEQGVEAEAKEDAGTEAYVSRIVSFTDCTGMRVTYDANASRQYVYEVEDGVLTDVKVEKTNEDGEAFLETPEFEGNVELQQPEEGETYTSIAADLFAGNRKVTYVKLPSGVSSITAESFRGCTALKSVYLPSTVKTIEKEAFRDCTAMTSIALPKSLLSVEEGAFLGATELELIYFRDGDFEGISIGANAFPSADEADELVVMAKKGSEAEVYARENGLTFEENEPDE